MAVPDGYPSCNATLPPKQRFARFPDEKFRFPKLPLARYVGDSSEAYHIDPEIHGP